MAHQNLLANQPSLICEDRPMTDPVSKNKTKSNNKKQWMVTKAFLRLHLRLSFDFYMHTLIHRLTCIHRK